MTFDMIDLEGRLIDEGNRVGVAFSYSQASVGYIRIGIVHEIKGPDNIIMKWEDGKLSRPMTYGKSNRWILL